MQSGSMTLLTTINIVLGAFRGEMTTFGGKVPLSGLYATLGLYKALQFYFNKHYSTAVVYTRGAATSLN